MNVPRPPADPAPARLLEMAKLTYKDFTFGGTIGVKFDVEVDVFPGEKSVLPLVLEQMMRHEMAISSETSRPIHERLACAVADLVRSEFSPMSVLVTVTQAITNKITGVAVAAWSVEVPEFPSAPLNNLGVFRA